MPSPLNADHPARETISLADCVSAIDDATAPDGWRPSPAVANRIALDAAQRAYATGRRDAIRELATAEQVAAELGVGQPYVRKLAERHGLGWHLAKTVWLFVPEEVATMRAALKPGRGRPAKRTADG